MGILGFGAIALVVVVVGVFLVVCHRRHPLFAVLGSACVKTGDVAAGKKIDQMCYMAQVLTVPALESSKIKQKLEKSVRRGVLTSFANAAKTGLAIDKCCQARLG